MVKILFNGNIIGEAKTLPTAISIAKLELDYLTLMVKSNGIFSFEEGEKVIASSKESAIYSQIVQEITQHIRMGKTSISDNWWELVCGCASYDDGDPINIATSDGDNLVAIATQIEMGKTKGIEMSLNGTYGTGWELIIR